tara:strand:+ start:5648 stop:6319 length:672 start_codon:yes stop_codon:yes gene_type:complete
MGDLWDFQIINRLENSGLIAGIIQTLNGEIYAGRDGADCVKESLKSLVKPFGLPLVGVAFLYFGCRWVAGWAMSKIEGWRWYFKWPLKIIAGLGGFLLFLGGLELLTNDEYTEDEERYHKFKSREEIYKKRAMEKLPEPSNTVESDGAGGLRRRIDEFKLHKIHSYNSPYKEAVYITDREIKPFGSGRKAHTTKPFVRYNRRKPHWEKVQRGIEGPFRQSRRL